MAYFAVRSSPTHTAAASKIIMPSNITSAGQLVCLKFCWQAKLVCSNDSWKIWKKSLNRASEDYLYLYLVPHTFCLWEAPHHEYDYLYFEVPRMKPLCHSFQLMVQFDLNTLSFFLSSLHAAFVNTIFATFLLLFIVTVFSIFVWFTASSHYSLYDFTINISPFLRHQGWN